MNEIERVPPNNLDAERCVIGACLLDRRAVETCLEMLKPGHFYLDANKHVFAAIQRVHSEDSPVDLATVSEVLRQAGRLGEIGVGYLMESVDLTPSSSNVRYYAEIVYACAWRRGAMSAANDATAWAMDTDMTLSELMARIDRRFDNLSSAAGQSVQTLDELLDETDAYLLAGRSVRVQCGIDTIDNYMGGGMLPGFFTLIGADPGYGKTRHLTRVAFNLLRQGIGVGFLSLEIPRQEIMAELIAMEMGINRDGLGSGEGDDFMAATPNDPEYLEARSHVAAWKLCLHSEPLDADEIEPLARRMARDRGMSVLLVDYAGLVSVRGSCGPERMEHVSQCLTDTYKRLKIAGIVLCHVTKKDGTIAPWYSRKLDQDCQSFWYIVPPENMAIDRGVYDWRNIKNRYARRSRHTLHLGWNQAFGYFEDLPHGQRGAGG